MWAAAVANLVKMMEHVTVKLMAMSVYVVMDTEAISVKRVHILDCLVSDRDSYTSTLLQKLMNVRAILVLMDSAWTTLVLILVCATLPTQESFVMKV